MVLVVVEMVVTDTVVCVVMVVLVSTVEVAVTDTVVNRVFVTVVVTGVSMQEQILAATDEGQDASVFQAEFLA